jgi:hypothetical protein
MYRIDAWVWPAQLRGVHRGLNGWKCVVADVENALERVKDGGLALLPGSMPKPPPSLSSPLIIITLLISEFVVPDSMS